jgi:hypothetical protein
LPSIAKHNPFPKDFFDDKKYSNRLNIDFHRDDILGQVNCLSKNYIMHKNIGNSNKISQLSLLSDDSN